MGTINRIKDVFVRLKSRRKNYFRRASLFAIISILLVSFQNCSQGKFEIDEGQMASASKSSPDVNGSGSGDASGNNGASDGSGAPTPPPTTVDPGPTAPVVTAEEIAAEKSRRQRCASAIKKPIITNSSAFDNKVVVMKNGLGGGSGDVQAGDNAYSVTVDNSRGIDSTKYSATDTCLFSTTMRIEPVTGDASRAAVWEHGIGNAGQALMPSGTTTAASLLNGNTIQVRTNANNQNNADFGVSVLTLNGGFNFRNGQNGNERDARCVQGSIYYRIFVRAETDGLDDPRPPFNLNDIRVENTSQTSDPVYVKVEVENACWAQVNLAKIMGAASPASIPATNAHLGTAVAIDGDWAAAVSDTETNGTYNKGYIYIFRKVSGSWTFFQKLEGPNGNGTALTGVSLKGDLLVVSSGGDGLYRLLPTLRVGYPGRVFLYRLSDSLLTTPFQTIDNPEGLKGTKFGSSVAITSGGVAIGDSFGIGKAFLYSLNGSLYGAGDTASRTPSATQNGTDIDPLILGYGASMVYQGGRLVVGAYNGNESYKGSVHIYDVEGGSFASAVRKDAPASITAKANFGYSIAFDGTALAVGAYEDAGTGNVAGALVYYKDYAATAAPKVILGSAAEERYGVSVAFAGDSLFVGSRGGTGSSGTISRYKKVENLDMAAATTYNSRMFVNRSYDASNGEGFSYSIAVLSGASEPTLLVSAQTKDYTISSGNTRSKAGGLYLYEVK